MCACVCAVDACECNGLIKPPNRSLFYISRVFNSASQIACVRVCMHIHTHARTNGWRSNVCVLRTSLARTHHHYGRKKEEAWNCERASARLCVRTGGRESSLAIRTPSFACARQSTANAHTHAHMPQTLANAHILGMCVGEKRSGKARILYSYWTTPLPHSIGLFLWPLLSTPFPFFLSHSSDLISVCAFVSLSPRNKVCIYCYSGTLY